MSARSALPIVQGIAGIAESERHRPVNELPDPGAAGAASPSAFRAAVDAAGAGGTVSLTSGKTYVLCTAVHIPHDDLTLEGNGARLRRCPENASTLTAPAPQGSTSVVVAHPERFEEGMWITFTTFLPSR